MNAIKNIFSKIPLDSKTKKIVGVSIVVIILFIIGFIILKHRQHSNENPTFFIEGKSAKKSITITKNLIFEPISGHNFTWSFWIYIDGWDYKLNQRKHVFTKGRLELYPKICSPAVFLDKSINDMIFLIQNEKQTDRFLIKDIPLNKWNPVAINNKNIDFYENGKLYKSKLLSGLPKINHGNLHVNHFGGFNGKILKLQYFPSYLSATQISKQANSAIQSNMFSRLVNKVTKIEIDLDRHKELPDPQSSCEITELKDHIHKNIHHNQYFSIIGNRYIKLKNNNLLKKIKISKNYTLIFTIIPKSTKSGWTNIIH